jgi:hypothetical protein
MNGSMKYCFFAVVCLALQGMILTGCKERKEERTYRNISGIARAVNLETGEVAMDFLHPKKGDKLELRGTVTQDTEIIIDGRIAKLEDVKIGEGVEVTGYVTGEGPDQKLVVTKVTIERPVPIKTGGTTNPATAPAKP